MRKKLASFKPKARIMELLGEQLIRSHTLALFELVKNSYDANAEEVTIKLNDIEDIENSSIEVIDDGAGMSFETVTTIWMEPGNSHKEEKRKELIKIEKSKRGRLPVGEKGVGRFAAHRLGSNINLITRAANKPEVVVNIDWNSFSKKNFLQDAKIKIQERYPEIFKGKKTGTRILITNLKNKWTRGEVRKLYKQILGMTAPTINHKNNLDFNVDFEFSPKKNWLEDLLDPNDIKNHSLFKFEFKFTNDHFEYRYGFTPFKAMVGDYGDLLPARKIPTKKSPNEFFVLRPPDHETSWTKRKKRNHPPVLSGPNGLGIGVITGTILGFDLDPIIKKRYLQDEAGGISEFLREQGGIRIFRDGLRVYDYGEPGNDWLGLDHRRIQKPMYKFGNQQLLGEINIDLGESYNLHEKTNREGFIENEAYNELKYAIICALTEFEAERNKDKKLLRDVLSIKPGTNVKNPSRKKNLESLLEDLSLLVVEKKAGDDITNLVKKVGSSYKEARDALLSSSGAGLGLVTVFHELERGVRALHRMIESDAKHEDLRRQSNELISMFHGVMYLVNKRSMETVKASELVSLALSTQVLRFKRHKIKCLNAFENLKLNDFEVKGIRKMLIASLVNLIDNAIYWTDQSESESLIWIGPSTDLGGQAIVIADNGPGFSDGPEDLIEPFFSRKVEGMGIGLYYTDWVMRSHGGRLAFPERNDLEIPKLLNGAVIALVFGQED